MRIFRWVQTCTVTMQCPSILGPFVEMQGQLNFELDEEDGKIRISGEVVCPTCHSYHKV